MALREINDCADTSGDRSAVPGGQAACQAQVRRIGRSAIDLNRTSHDGGTVRARRPGLRDVPPAMRVARAVQSFARLVF